MLLGGVISEDTYTFLAFSDLTCQFEDKRIVVFWSYSAGWQQENWSWNCLVGEGFVSKPDKKIFFFSIWVFFHEHSQFTGQQGKGEGIYLTPLYHFHPLHRHLDISRAITAESSHLRIAGSRTRTGNLWFSSVIC